MRTLMMLLAYLVSLINSVLIRNTTGSKNVLEDTIKEKN